MTAEEAKAKKWISVEERLPDNSQVVNICLAGCMVTSGHYVHGHKLWRQGHSFSAKFNIEKGLVTHWMPLLSHPLPPASKWRRKESDEQPRCLCAHNRRYGDLLRGFLGLAGLVCKHNRRRHHPLGGEEGGAQVSETRIPDSEWKWFGNAGHLCVRYACRFHLCTKVGNFMVSTVGEYWPERSSREIHAKFQDADWLAENKHLRGDAFDCAYMERFGFTEIGFGRKYETLIFDAGSPCTAKDCNCGMPCPTSWTGLDGDSYNDAGSATRGHYAMCEKYAVLEQSVTAEAEGK